MRHQRAPVKLALRGGQWGKRSQDIEAPSLLEISISGTEGKALLLSHDLEVGTFHFQYMRMEKSIAKPQ